MGAYYMSLVQFVCELVLFLSAAAIVLVPSAYLYANVRRRLRSEKRLEFVDFDDGQGRVPARRHENGGGWVACSACVDDTAYVGKDARVCGFAQVRGEAMVVGHALVADHAVVRDHAVVADYALVADHALVCDYARVIDRGCVLGDVVVSGDREVSNIATARDERRPILAVVGQ